MKYLRDADDNTVVVPYDVGGTTYTPAVYRSPLAGLGEMGFMSKIGIVIAVAVAAIFFYKFVSGNGGGNLVMANPGRKRRGRRRK